MILPMPNQTLAAGAEMEWEVTPQLLCHPVRLFLDDDTARNCKILDIKVGHTSYTVAAGSIPAIHFHKELNTPEAMRIDLPVIDPNIPITIRILNDCPAATRLSGGWEVIQDDELIKAELARQMELRTDPHEKKKLLALERSAKALENIAEMMKAGQMVK